MIVRGSEMPGRQLDGGVQRKVLAHGATLMLVEFRFAKGGVGQPHRHAEHEQVGYIVRGRFEVTVGDETSVLGAGDCYFAAPDVLHGVVALEDGVIVDAFTPIREDFL